MKSYGLCVRPRRYGPGNSKLLLGFVSEYLVLHDPSLEAVRATRRVPEMERA